MSRFKYLARSTTSRKVSGFVDAVSKPEALEQLARRDLFVVAIEPATHSNRWAGSTRRINKRRLTMLYSQLVDLLSSGVPIARSLEVIARQSSDGAVKDIMGDLAKQLGDGSSLSGAMEKHRNTFGDLAISMVRAGEEGGFLQEVLGHIADYTQRQQRLQSRVFGALAYPAFLLCVTAVVLVVMMTVFVPNFAPIFDRMRETGNLPVLTETLLVTSEQFEAHWFLFVVGIATFITLGMIAIRTESGAATMDRIKLSVPGMNRFWRGLAVARFSRILGTMLAGGVPILTALRISKNSTGNRILARAIGDAAVNLEQGDGLAQPLRNSGAFPEDIIEMIAVGEESNRLQRVLINVADTTEARLGDQTDVLIRLLEPVLLLVLAGITLLIVTALLLPVLNMGQLV